MVKDIESPRAHWLRRARKLGSPLLAAKSFNYKIIKSIRRFSFLSFSRKLGAIGLDPPKPVAISLFKFIPLIIRYFTKSCECLCDNKRLYSAEPALSEFSYFCPFPINQYRTENAKLIPWAGNFTQFIG